MSWMARGAHLPVRRAGLALGVDAGAHHRRPVLAGQGQELVEPRAGVVALLEVDRVEHGPPPDPPQGGLDHRCLGGVDHQGDARLGGEARRHLGHVGHAVGAGVVHAHVEDVGALLHLVAGHGHGGVPVGLEHGLAELLRPVGVGALAHDEERGVLVERHVAVDRGGPRLVLGVARRGHEVPAPLHHSPEMVGGGPAAPADDAHPHLGHEPLQMVRQLLRREVVVHLAVHHRGQAGVGLRGDGHAAVLGQVAHGLAHLGRSRGAVEPDDVGAHGVEGGQGGADLGAGEHAPGELDGHLHLERYAPPGAHHGALARVQRRLGLEQVVDRLHHQQVHAPGQQGGGLLLVGVTQLGVGDLPEGGKACRGRGCPPPTGAGRRRPRRRPPPPGRSAPR